MHRAPILLALAFALVACGGDDDAGPGDAASDARDVAPDAAPTATDTASPPDATGAPDARGGGDGDALADDASTASDATQDTSSGPDATRDTSADADADTTPRDTADAAAGDTKAPCPRALGPADRARRFVFAKPYEGDDDTGWTYQIGALDAAGATVDVDGTTFTLGGRAPFGKIAFTPDGEIGLVVFDDGDLGVFALDSDGAPTVVHPRLDVGVYAHAVRVSPDGATAWILSSQWVEHGGGLYAAAIGCDGALGPARLVTESKLPGDLVWPTADNDRALVAADVILGSPAGTSAHLLDLTPHAASRVASADAFGDADVIVSAIAPTHDGGELLIGDNHAFGGGDRVAIVSVDGGALAPAHVVAGIEDPVDIVTSPFDATALVVSGFGDHLVRLVRDPDEGWVNQGPLSYEGARPQLPDSGAAVRRGPAAGVVLVAENVGIRRVRFAPGGVITDHGVTPAGAITGAIGIQP